MTEKKHSLIRPKLFAGFCIVEFLVLIALKTLSVINPNTIAKDIIMFSAIFINAAFMLFLITQVKKAGKDVKITGIPLAVFCTLLADFFLVLCFALASRDLIPFMTPIAADMAGFFVFGIVQVIYACYLGLTKRRLIVRIAFYAAFIAVIFALGLMTLDRFIACLSMSQLILNVIYVWIDHRKTRTRTSLLLAVGISLFFACDAFIMMRMLLPPVGFIYSAICFMVWVFYIPSQVVLTSAYLSDRTDA